VVVSDPRFVCNPVEYAVNVLDDEPRRRLFVRVPVTAELFASIGQVSGDAGEVV
jgi:hypothetical protein